MTKIHALKPYMYFSFRDKTMQVERSWKFLVAQI